MKTRYVILAGVEKGGVTRFGRHNYYFSWLDSDFRTKNTKWSWFNARNYCRKRCMDLVSFESRQEWDWVQGFIDGEAFVNFPKYYPKRM